MKKKTQILIAKEAGISQGYLSKILSGEANPTIDVISKISKASGVSVKALLSLCMNKTDKAA